MTSAPLMTDAEVEKRLFAMLASQERARTFAAMKANPLLLIRFFNVKFKKKGCTAAQFLAAVDRIEIRLQVANDLIRLMKLSL